MKLFSRNKVAIFVLSVLVVVAIDSVAPLIEKIQQSYPNVSATVIKQTITLPSTVAIFFSLISGQLVRFLSKKTIVLIGLVLYSVGGLGAGMVPTFPLHLALRFIVGAGIGLVNPIRISLIADFCQREERATMMGYSLSFSQIVSFFIPPLAAGLGAANWRNAFFIYLIGLAILIFMMIALEDSVEKAEVIEREIDKIWIPPIVFLYAGAGMAVMSFFFVQVTDLSYLVAAKTRISSFAAPFGLSISTLGTVFSGAMFSKIRVKIQKWIFPLGSLLCVGGFF